jgi:hypothetical protein
MELRFVALGAKDDALSVQPAPQGFTAIEMKHDHYFLKSRRAG